MLKKFLRSKVFVLSMLVTSVGSEVRGMEFNFPDENNGAFGDNLYSYDDLYNYFNFDDNGFPNMFEDQGNDESIQGTNAAPQMPPVITAQTNQPMNVTDDNLENANPLVPAIVPKRNPKYYPPNWDSSGAGQFFYEHPEYNVSAISLYHLYTQMRLVGLPDNLATLTRDDCGNTLQVRTWFADNWDNIKNIKDYVNEAIQTNPQTNRGTRALYSEDWKGSDAEKFCIDLGLTNICQIRRFVASARALGCQVRGIPYDAVEGRQVFMKEVYPVLARLSEEELQKIANYKSLEKEEKDATQDFLHPNRRSSRVMRGTSEINKQWEESYIGQWCKQLGIEETKKLLEWYTDFVEKNSDLNLEKLTRSERRNPTLLKQFILKQFRSTDKLRETAQRLTRMLQNPQ